MFEPALFRKSVCEPVNVQG